MKLTKRHAVSVAAAALLATGVAAVAGAGDSGFNFFGFFGGGTTSTTTNTQTTQEAPKKTAPGEIPEGYQLVAENGNLELFLDQNAVQFIIRDKKTKTLWRTNPDTSGRNLAVNELWKQHMASQFILNYTDARKRHVKSTNNINEKAVVSYEPIDRGVRATFRIDSLKMQIQMEYILGPDYLEVRIPDKGIQETGEFLIVSLEVVPFFGAGWDDDQGYMVIPDGVGAISYFKKDHPRYQRQFSEYAYGADTYNFSRQFIIDLFRVSAQNVVPMPVFGIVRNGSAFVAVVTEGDFNAKINAAPSGYIVPINRESAEFVFRKQFQAPLARTRQVTTIESERVKEDRAVRYYLLTGQEANYVGMANRYRLYLKERFGIQGKFASRSSTAPLHLRILQGMLKEGLVTDQLLLMTTFEQDIEILKQLLDAGVKDLDVTLVGWTPNGYRGSYPNRLPPEPALGGTAGLRKLAEFAKENGITLYLEDNYIDAFLRNRGFSARNDVIRDSSRLPVANRYTGHYLLNPIVAYHKFAARDIPRMKQYGVAGLDLEQMGKVLLSDRNQKYPLSRSQSAQVYLALASMAKKELGQVAVQGGNAYLLQVADKVTDAPLEESRLVFVDKAIPFYPIVVHGLIPYYWWPGNLRSDPRREYLQMIEYGALPIFEVTWQDSSLLRRTRYNYLWSSKFSQWFDDIVQEYREVSEKMGYLQPLAITGHQYLTDDVVETKYEDGSRVIINYGRQPYQLGNVKVGPLDYVLLRPGR